MVAPKEATLGGKLGSSKLGTSTAGSDFLPGISRYVYANKYIYIYVIIYIYTYIYIYVCVCVIIINIYIYMYVCVCVL